MRTRVRLLVAFVAVYAVLAVATGATVLLVMESSLSAAAEVRVTRVLAAGGFSLSPEVVARMETLTGYRIQPLAAEDALPEGWLRVDHQGTVLAVDYRSEEYHRLTRAVIGGTAVALVLGVLLFAAVAWALARQFAVPLERLAVAARTIGRGNLDVAVVSSGTAEVRALGEDLEQMRVRLAALDRANRQAERLATLGLFTATIAHEVRNPLSAVRLTVQLLRRRHGEDPGLALVEEELERLDLIIDELLAFSKGVTVERQVTDLRPVAEHIAHLLRRQAEHAGVTVQVEGECTLNVDPARLRQLLLNLTLNAIQAQHGDEGTVIIRLRSDGLEVEDHGPGVPAELVPHLFEPFTTGRKEGTGLGLHLASAVANAHGAQLRYLRSDHRTCFRVEGLADATT
jgi:signal transduction histidine kinase